MIRPKVTVVGGGYPGQRSVTVLVGHAWPDRDSGLPIDVETALDIRFPENTGAVLGRILQAMQSILIHELMECFHLDGERMFDPHAPVPTFVR